MDDKIPFGKGYYVFILLICILSVWATDLPRVLSRACAHWDGIPSRFPLREFSLNRLSTQYRSTLRAGRSSAALRPILRRSSMRKVAPSAQPTATAISSTLARVVCKRCVARSTRKSWKYDRE
jgi:hypothetical protein